MSSLSIGYCCKSSISLGSAGQPGGVAYLAHIGGFAAGLIFFMIFRAFSRNWLRTLLEVSHAYFNFLSQRGCFYFWPYFFHLRFHQLPRIININDFIQLVPTMIDSVPAFSYDLGSDIYSNVYSSKDVAFTNPKRLLKICLKENQNTR